MSDIINLHIKSGESLSYVIDKQLDEELGKDVKLNLKEWNCVFDIIKKNQVETNKNQFTEKDTDIKNGKHFVVDANSDYQIKSDVWSQIVEIAKKRFGSTKDVEKEKQVTAPDAKKVEKSEKTEVIAILKQAKVNYNDIDTDDIVKKYNAIKTANPDIKESDLNQRIINYANGLRYHKAETKFAELWKSGTENSKEKYENKAVTDAIRNGSIEEFKVAFHKAAQEYVELYDSAEGDGKIDIKELIAMEEKEQGRALTTEEKKKAKKEAINRVAILDLNKNDKIDEDEIAAYLWAMSKINDGQNGKTAQDITFEEWKTTQEAMGILTLGNKATQKDIDEYNKFYETLKEGYNNLKK